MITLDLVLFTLVVQVGLVVFLATHRGRVTRSEVMVGLALGFELAPLVLAALNALIPGLVAPDPQPWKTHERQVALTFMALMATVLVTEHQQPAPKEILEHPRTRAVGPPPWLIAVLILLLFGLFLPSFGPL